MFYVRARAIICLVVWYYLLFIQLNWSFMLHGSGALKTANLHAHSSAVTARCNAPHDGSALKTANLQAHSPVDRHF